MRAAIRHPLLRLRHHGWWLLRTLRTGIAPGPPRRWLFSSRADWENDVRSAFRRSRHELVFGALTAESLGAYDAIVPLTIADVRHLAARPDLAAHSLIPIPAASVVELCDDKLALNLALQSAGFGEHVPPMGRASRAPFLVKQRVDENSRSCVIVDHSHAGSAPVFDRHGNAELVQTFIPGRIEHALHVLFRDGRIEWCLNIEYLFATDRPIKGRDPAQHQGLSSARHLELWTRMLNAIGFEGLCCINYKPGVRTPQLIEINPRCGGSLARHFHFLADHVSRHAARRRSAVGPARHAGDHRVRGTGRQPSMKE